jgi:ribosomal protein S18 acetylase RimI-like enzyme
MTEPMPLADPVALVELPVMATPYRRMEANLLASWERYATDATHARVERLPGAAIAVFPEPPERIVYNNALLERELRAPAADVAIDAIATVYADAGVEDYAVWAHESEAASIDALEARGYHVDTWTRAMAMSLDSISLPRPRLELGPSEWPDYLELLTRLGAPEGLLTDVDPDAFHVRVAAVNGESVATAIAYDHGGACGIYNVGTLPQLRRRGLATALTTLHLYDARERGCTSASLQATEVAQGLYAALGFGDLGRFIEYAK